MTNDWIVHEIKKPIDFSNMTPAAFWKWARQGLAIPIIKCPYCNEEFKQETLDPIDPFVCDACGYPFYEE